MPRKPRHPNTLTQEEREMWKNIRADLGKKRLEARKTPPNGCYVGADQRLPRRRY